MSFLNQTLNQLEEELEELRALKADIASSMKPIVDQYEEINIQIAVTLKKIQIKKLQS